MQVGDINTYLYTQKINEMMKTAQNTDKTSNLTQTTEFASLLSDEIANMSEFSELAGALDQSVLGNVSNMTDLSTLSNDLLHTNSGRKVIAQLAQGQLDSIVTMGNNNDQNPTVMDMMDSYSDSVSDTEQLSNVLEQVMESLNTSQKN